MISQILKTVRFFNRIMSRNDGLPTYEPFPRPAYKLGEICKATVYKKHIYFHCRSNC